MEFIIYSDESVSKGELYSDFFGGALVTSQDWNEIITALEARKKELNLLGEIKWIKVSVSYLEKYKQMMDLFFSFIMQDKIKLRIMFRDSSQIPHERKDSRTSNKYHLLYYQFIKHAFGIVYHDKRSNRPIYLRLFFDQIADTARQNKLFRKHILHLQRLVQFKKARIIIRPKDIIEIDSHKHPILQCMDVVLGAMSFRLNNKHLETVPGTNERGRKTMAKEELFNHILDLIIKTNKDPFFIISQTTLPNKAKYRWLTPYRHWKFVAAEYLIKGV